MATNVLNGKGKLYEARSEKCISEASYKIYEEVDESGILIRWTGEITLTTETCVGNTNTYMLELEDNRKGRCSLRRRINRAVTLLPPRYVYHLYGNGQLT